jgi:hypothetical protein
MAANKIIRLGPVALTNVTTTNILNPPTVTGGTGLAGINTSTYLVLRHIRITNKTTTAVAFTLYIGATGANVAGTEFMGGTTSVAANSYVDWYGMLRLDVADYLVGGASAATSLTFQAEGEIGVA